MIFVEMLKNYRAFKLKLKLVPLAGSDCKAATDNFRNAYNHGFSSPFVIGFTQVVRREMKDGLLRYPLGGTHPLGIDKVADLLEIELDHCYQAFQAFIAEQIKAIFACEAETKRTQHDA